jgi:putative transposase
LPLDTRRLLVELSHPQLPIIEQCKLLGVARSSLYYQPEPIAPSELALMRKIDELYTAHPFFGSRRMRVVLSQEGTPLNRKHVQRLMRLMGLEAIYAKKNTSKANPGHKKFPYLLRDLAIDRPDQVWGCDITYVPLRHGFVFLVAIIDWFSRYVVAWDISLTLDSEFCLTTLDAALKVAIPTIFNSDQGCQFTTELFTTKVTKAGAQMSMDGKGRAFDNIFTERLWRTVKYEDIYIKDYESVQALRLGLVRYFEFYNTKRPHQALDYRTSAEVYWSRTSGVPMLARK